MSRERLPCVVGAGEVTICSPFREHVPHLGQCGAHFIGLNDRHLPWELDGIPAVEHIRRHWLQLKPHVESRIGIAQHGP